MTLYERLILKSELVDPDAVGGEKTGENEVGGAEGMLVEKELDEGVHLPEWLASGGGSHSRPMML